MILPDLVSITAKIHPSNPAIIFKDQVISYAELDQQVNHLALGLYELGIRKGDTVGLILRNSPEFVTMMMALAKLGAVSVPINFLEKAEHISRILNDARASAVLTSIEFLASVFQAQRHIKTLRHIILKEGFHEHTIDLKSLMTPAKAALPSTVLNEDDLVILLYTSGTTGQPKGVMLSHKNFLSNVTQCLSVIKINERDVFLCVLPMFHSFAWTTCVLLPLKCGLPIVVMDTLLPFESVIHAIWKHQVTIFIAVPQIFSALCQKITGAKAFLIRWLNPIRLCISGAAALPSAVLEKFQKTFAIPLIEGYGLTEAAPVCTLNPIEKIKPGTVGQALTGVELDIHDDQGHCLPQGQVGEIWVRGDNIMKGYYRKPEETKAVLSADGWLKTGDVGRLDKDGYLTIVDRKKDLIIVKGLNVYPHDIETVIAQHPHVHEVAVVGKLNPESGEEVIRAYITLKEEQALNKAEIHDLCRTNLAPYKRPKEIHILEKMPKSSLQKILKKELRAL